MTPTLTTGSRWRGPGILGIAVLALLTLAGGSLAQSPAPAASPGPMASAAPEASPEPSVAAGRARRVITCPRARRGDRWQGRRPGTMGDQERVRPRDLRRMPRGPRWSDERSRRQTRLVVPRGWSDERSRRQTRLVVPRAPRIPARLASIEAIEGTAITLVTPDGWSRTIETSGVPIIRGGTQIEVADLRVGDRVLVRQRRGADGTWQVSRVRVLLTTVRGTVTGVTPDGFELQTRRGDSVSVRVSGTTTWVLGCAIDPDAPLEVGTRVAARGVGATDGSLDATVVAAARPPRRGPGRDRPRPGAVASPAPVASPSAVAPSA